MNITHSSFSSIRIINGHALAVINIPWTGYWKWPALAAVVTALEFSLWFLNSGYCSPKPPLHPWRLSSASFSSCLPKLFCLCSVSLPLGDFSGNVESSQTSGCFVWFAHQKQPSSENSGSLSQVKLSYCVSDPLEILFRIHYLISGKMADWLKYFSFLKKKAININSHVFLNKKY